MLVCFHREYIIGLVQTKSEFYLGLSTKPYLFSLARNALTLSMEEAESLMAYAWIFPRHLESWLQAPSRSPSFPHSSSILYPLRILRQAVQQP
jgi:hypothetical protein